MTNKPVENITEDEAELYDRQIRLWGLDAQNRLRQSRILIVGMKGLGCEVAKNLVLAGVKSLTMMDNHVVSEEDKASQFFAPRDKVGENRALASVARCQQLNPLVNVTADTSNVAEKPEEFFKDFDVVVLTGGCSEEELVKVNGFCRKLGVKFFAGDVMGFFGYSFMDLIEHEYAEEVQVNPTPTSADDAPPAKKAKKDEEPETKVVKSKATFVPLEKALKVDWAKDEKYVKRIKRMDPGYFVLQILFEFQRREGCFPRPSKRDADLEILKTIRDKISFDNKLPNDKVSDRLLSLLFAELSPVAAIVGGVCGQEIIKCISNKDAPHNNFFIYNPVPGAGVVENIGY